MGTPGPVALILVALAVLLAAGFLVPRRRRGAAVPAGPRTVAELVRLHAERAAGSGVEVPAALPAALPDALRAAPSAALPDADPAAEPRSASDADRAATAVRPETEQTDAAAPEQDAPPAARPSAAAAT